MKSLGKALPLSSAESTLALIVLLMTLEVGIKGLGVVHPRASSDCFQALPPGSAQAKAGQIICLIDMLLQLAKLRRRLARCHPQPFRQEWFSDGIRTEISQ